MISHESVAESVKHEEPEQRRECCHKEERADFHTSPGKPPAHQNRDRQRNTRQKPDVGSWIHRIDFPLRINKGQIRGPKYFT